MSRCDLFYQFEKKQYYRILHEGDDGVQLLVELDERFVPEALQKILNSEIEFDTNWLTLDFMDPVKITEKLNGKSILDWAYEVGIHINKLRTNVDIYAYVKADMYSPAQYLHVARIPEGDIAKFLYIRALARHEREELFEQALRAAEGHQYAAKVPLIEAEFGHLITTDKWGLAANFNPTYDDALERVAQKYRQEFEEAGLGPAEIEHQLTNNAESIAQEAEQIIIQMNDKLAFANPSTSSTIIQSTLSRSGDELIAMRQMMQQSAEGAGELTKPEFLRSVEEFLVQKRLLDRTKRGTATDDTLAELRRSIRFPTDPMNMSDAQIRVIIEFLKKNEDDFGYVFHHTAHTWLNDLGYPMLEIQLIRKDAHAKYMTILIEETSETSIRKWYDLPWSDDMDLIEYIPVVENVLGHVGSCHPIRVFYGLKGYGR